MIGLKRGTVQLENNYPEWVDLFEKTAERIRKKVGNLVSDIQHVGSTAVPGLLAKPIIDIAIAVSSRDLIPSVVTALVEIGYIDRGDGGRDGGYLLVQECEPNVRTEHIHIVEETDRQWRDYILFRDSLRDDPSLREEYSQLKKMLAAENRKDRNAYTMGKHDFIRGLVGNRY
jgi:GrpB-like predicted nucleotidyltransferase (UPF0157 family)